MDAFYWPRELKNHQAGKTCNPSHQNEMMRIAVEHETIVNDSVYNLHWAHNRMMAATLSVPASLARWKRRLAKLCRSDFRDLLFKCRSLACLMVVWDTLDDNDSSLACNSLTRRGNRFRVAMFMAVVMSVFRSQALYYNKNACTYKHSDQKKKWLFVFNENTQHENE